MGTALEPLEPHPPHHLQLPAWAGWTEGEGPCGQGSCGGQGLTPHRTWPRRVPRSGPGSWLRLQGEERSDEGGQCQPCVLAGTHRNQPSSLILVSPKHKLHPSLPHASSSCWRCHFCWRCHLCHPCPPSPWGLLSWGSARGKVGELLVESKAGAVPSAALSCMG